MLGLLDGVPWVLRIHVHLLNAKRMLSELSSLKKKEKKTIHQANLITCLTNSSALSAFPFLFLSIK